MYKEIETLDYIQQYNSYIKRYLTKQFQRYSLYIVEVLVVNAAFIQTICVAVNIIL